MIISRNLLSAIKRYFFLSLILVFAGSCGNSTPKVSFNAVDLGLPSGCLWADMNLGATSVEDYGNYYFWGDTEPITTGSNYKYVNDCFYNGGGETKYLKYVSDGQYGNVDKKVILDSVDDAAYLATGGEWSIPTEADIDELLQYCNWEVANLNGKPGIKFIGPNGNSIFLPNPGEYNTLLFTLNEGFGTNYWTNSSCHSSPQYHWNRNSGDTWVTWEQDESLGEDFAFGLKLGPTYQKMEVKKDFAYRVHDGLIRPVYHK